MSDRKYSMLRLEDIYEAERVAMRKAAEAAANPESGVFADFKLVFFLGGIRAVMDEIEAMVDAKEKESGGGE